jgi:transposase
MAKTHAPYAPSFKIEAVRLVHSTDKPLPAIAADLGVSEPTLRNWVRQAEIDDGTCDGLTTAERAELIRLRREVRTLKQERDILKKAAAFFARESDVTR